MYFGIILDALLFFLQLKFKNRVLKKMFIYYYEYYSNQLLSENKPYSLNSTYNYLCLEEFTI